MPFYDQKSGEFKVLYLQEYDNNPAYNYHPIWGVATKDGAHYQSMGEVLPTATSSMEQDAALGTGCAVYNEKDNLYYIYYTGHNPKCKNTEVVMRATSPDMKAWTKDNLWTLKGVDYGYTATDFRDPQVFKAEDGRYHMVIASTLKFAEFVSDDLKTWNRSEEHTSELQSRQYLVCRLLLEKKKKQNSVTVYDQHLTEQIEVYRSMKRIKRMRHS